LRYSDEISIGRYWLELTCFKIEEFLSWISRAQGGNSFVKKLPLASVKKHGRYCRFPLHFPPR
jgi:hypothetical protein